MILPKFEYHEPSTLAEACQMMTDYKKSVRPLGGGTDLLVNMKKKVMSPAHLVSMGCVQEIKTLDQNKKRLNIGAGLTVADIGESEVIETHLNALKCGALALGSPLIRNLATIGGNVSSARPAADIPPSLMVYNAKAVVVSASGKREIPVEELIIGPGRTQVGPDELVSGFVVEIPEGFQGAGYINLGIRKAQDINIVNVASYLALDNAGKTVVSARIVLGSVGPTPLRAKKAEAFLVGREIGSGLFESVGLTAMEDCKPITDFRGSDEYRRQMVAVLTRRTLDLALADARKRTN